MRVSKFILAIIFLSASGIVFAQERKAGKAELLAILKIILKSDSLSFEQFRSIGKCRCLDTLAVQKFGKVEEKARLYNRYRLDIGTGAHPFPVAVNEDTVHSALDRFYSENIDSTIKWLKRFDEYYHIKRSSYLICETMYSDTGKLRSLYLSIIESDNSYPVKKDWWDESYILNLIGKFESRNTRSKW